MTTQQFMLGDVRVPYDERILALNPIAFWGLDDTAGIVAVEKVNGGAWNGTYTNTDGITLNEPGIGDGNPSTLFNRLNNENGNVAIASAGLSAGYDGDEGTIGMWVKPYNAGTWESGNGSRFFSIQVDFNDRLVLEITGNPSNELRFMREANNVMTQTEDRPYSSLMWQHWMGRWSRSLDTQDLLLNGVSVLEQPTSQDWTGGALDPDVTRIGSFNAAGTAEMDGWLAKAVIFDRRITDIEALSVGRVL